MAPKSFSYNWWSFLLFCYEYGCGNDGLLRLGCVLLHISGVCTNVIVLALLVWGSGAKDIKNRMGSHSAWYEVNGQCQKGRVYWRKVLSLFFEVMIIISMYTFSGIPKSWDNTW